jgi:glycine dehydrogenase
VTQHTDPRPFAERHLGPDPGDVQRMLDALGLASLDAMLDVAVPESIRTREPLGLTATPDERQALQRLRQFADANRVRTSLIGCGYSGTIVPPVIQRNVLENPAWYTAYTPYQPEISQGRLEALLNFQTVVADLTGMDIANASLLDEATAAAEAMTLARRVSKAADDVFLVDADCHPQVVEVRTSTRTARSGSCWPTPVPPEFSAMSHPSPSGLTPWGPSSS